jgi:hypothetical protein
MIWSDVVHWMRTSQLVIGISENVQTAHEMLSDRQAAQSIGSVVNISVFARLVQQAPLGVLTACQNVFLQRPLVEQMISDADALYKVGDKYENYIFDKIENLQPSDYKLMEKRLPARRNSNHQPVCSYVLENPPQASFVC